MVVLFLWACAASNSTPAPPAPVEPAAPTAPSDPVAKPDMPAEPPVDVPDPRMPALTDEQISCATVDECVAVELMCCNACNGGLAVAINKTSEEAVMKLKQPGCEEMMCTEMACAPHKLACTEGKCELVKPPKPVILK